LGDSYIRLFNAKGVCFASNDNAAAPGEVASLDSYIEYNFVNSGTYYVGVSGNGNRSYNAVTGDGDAAGSTGAYTVTIETSLKPGDILLYQGAKWLSLSAPIQAAEAAQLFTPNAYSHAAMYLGNNQVAEMNYLPNESLTQARCVIRSLTESIAGSTVSVFHDTRIGSHGQAVANAAIAYAGIPYAFDQIVALGELAVNPLGLTAIALSSGIYNGSTRMICSELVARAYSNAGVPITINRAWVNMVGYALWPQTTRLDFTTPTMLSLSPDLQNLNHVW
jgi:cell wall-associated NlpC family hydrolase